MKRNVKKSESGLPGRQALNLLATLVLVLAAVGAVERDANALPAGKPIRTDTDGDRASGVEVVRGAHVPWRAGHQNSLMIRPLGYSVRSAPRLVVVSGDTLRRPVVFADTLETGVIASSFGEAAGIDAAELAGRPAYDVAMYMPSPWIESIAADSVALVRLSPLRADRRGRLYPPVDGLEAVFVFESEPPDGGPAVRRIGVQGLTVLRRRGIALRSVE